MISSTLSRTHREIARVTSAQERKIGTYEVQEKQRRVIHRPEMASWPHYIGTDQFRNIRMEGDRLILSEKETPPNGEPHEYQITWVRVKKQGQ